MMTDSARDADPTSEPEDPRWPPLASNGLWEEPKPGECPRYSKVFDPNAAPPLQNLPQQEAAVAEITALTRDAYTVRYARPTALGVVALVMGNLEVAKAQLKEYGVTLVYAWDTSWESEGLDADQRVHGVIADQLQPVAEAVRRRFPVFDDEVGLALWVDAGGVLVQWKEPVPAEIKALEDLSYGSGAHVYVEGVRYSDPELNDASSRVFDELKGTDVELSSGSRCGDNSGIVIGVVPDYLRGREQELKKRFEEIAGVPVTVVPEERADLL